MLLIAGEMGGYMGLLLGGSVITMLELLDLVVYNSIIKMAIANKDRRNSVKQIKVDEAPKRDGKASTAKDNNTKPDKTKYRPPPYRKLDAGKTNFQAEYST